MGGGGRETSDARFSPTILMIIIIVLFYRQAYYTIIVQGRGCFEADKIIFLTSNSIWFAFSHIAFSLNSSLCKTPVEVRKQRQVSRAAFYRRFNTEGNPRSWGIQFWNGADEQLMTILLPNPFVDGENLLPEGKPDLSKLALYQELKDIYVLGIQPIPFSKNPLKHSYISVCTSTRCLPSRKWQPTFDALKSAVENAGLDIEVRTSGCLEVCQQGPVVFYSDDRTWYTRVNSSVAETIVNEHLLKGNKIIEHCYPPYSV